MAASAADLGGALGGVALGVFGSRLGEAESLGEATTALGAGAARFGVPADGATAGGSLGAAVALGVAGGLGAGLVLGEGAALAVGSTGVGAT